MPADLSEMPVNGAGLQYEYVPLATSRDIRLFHIPIQDPQVPSTNIKGSFITISLDDIQTPYTAISYCWGPPAIAERVWLSSEQYLGITRSVTDILHHFINERKERYLWIDALCIDQRNNQEKGSQVRLMRDIYTFADQVIAWLGPSSADSDLAMEFIAFFSDANGNNPIGARGNEDNMMKFQRLIAGTKFESTKLECIYNLFDRPWFHRMWVVQEMVLSRHTILICGEMMLEWQAMDSILESLPARYLHKLVDGETTVLSLGISNFDLMFTISKIHNMKKELPLQGLMLWCRRFLATDSRDKLFALLGIATDAGDRLLDPDYESPYHTVFTNMTRHLLTRGNDLDLFYVAGIGTRRVLTGPLPSWVADWTTEIGGAGSNLGAISDNVGYQASGNCKPAVRPGPDPESLILKGNFVDVITECHDSRGTSYLPDGSEQMKRKISAQLDWLSKMEQVAASVQPYPTGEEWEDVLYFAHTANAMGVACTRGSIKYRSDYQDYLFSLKARLSDTYHDLPEGQRARAEIFHTNLFNVGQRSFFTTAKGYIGRGPQMNVSPGDEVCILYGLTTPFVIRKNTMSSARDGEEEINAMQTTYTLIGESYVHGLMDGEGVDDGKERDFLFV